MSNELSISINEYMDSLHKIVSSQYGDAIPKEEAIRHVLATAARLQVAVLDHVWRVMETPISREEFFARGAARLLEEEDKIPHLEKALMLATAAGDMDPLLVEQLIEEDGFEVGVLQTMYGLINAYLRTGAYRNGEDPHEVFAALVDARSL